MLRVNKEGGEKEKDDESPGVSMASVETGEIPGVQHLDDVMEVEAPGNTETANPSRNKTPRVTFGEKFRLSPHHNDSPQLNDSSRSKKGGSDMSTIFRPTIREPARTKTMPLTYLFGTNEKTKCGKIIFCICSGSAVVLGLTALIIGIVFEDERYCKAERTLYKWLVGDGISLFLTGCLTAARVPTLEQPLSQNDNFLKWVLFIIIVEWISCGSAAILITIVQHDVIKDCNQVLFVTLAVTTIIMWVAVILFAGLTYLKRRQSNAVYLKTAIDWPLFSAMKTNLTGLVPPSETTSHR